MNHSDFSACGNRFLNSSKYSSKAVIKHTLTLTSISLILSYNSKPFIRGILISSNNRSYTPALWADNDFMGSLNISTINPAHSRPILKHHAMSSSSSTIRIHYLLVAPVITKDFAVPNNYCVRTKDYLIHYQKTFLG